MITPPKKNMTDPELDKLERDHMYYGPSGVTQVVIKKSELYDLIRCNRMFNAMQESMREFRDTPAEPCVRHRAAGI